MQITKRAVEALERGEAIWDESLKGFGVRRQKKTCSYFVKYRVFGRQQLYTLGQHGPLTPDEARRKAKRILGQVANGQNPAAEKMEAKDRAGDTLGKLIDEYLPEAEKTQRPKTLSGTKRHLAKHWKPLHSLSIFDITRRHVASRLREIEANHGQVAAIRARSALSKMFKWATKEGYEVANPVTGTNCPGEPDARDRVLTDAELIEVWKACGDDDYGRIVRLLILTGQRCAEVGGLNRSEITDDLWTIPGERTKNHCEHVLPLSKATQAIIITALRSTNRDYAFGNGPRRKGDPDRGFSGWSKSKAKFDKRISVSDWTLHDLRRTCATVMADRLGVLPHIVEAILNHISGHKAGVAGVYNRARYLPQMKSALDLWANHIAKLTGGNILGIEG